MLAIFMDGIIEGSGVFLSSFSWILENCYVTANWEFYSVHASCDGAKRIELLLYSLVVLNRFLAALKHATDEEELKYMTDKINTNFSNYSAWHNRRHVFLLSL